MTGAQFVSRQRPALVGRGRISTVLLLALAVLAVVRFFVGLYTERTWFLSIGEGSVWARQTVLRLGLSFGVFVLTSLILWFNLVVAGRSELSARAAVENATTLRNLPTNFSGRAGRWPRVAAALIVGSLISPILGDAWKELALLLFRSPHSTSPIRVLGFRADVSVFVLPFFSSVTLWLITVLVVCFATCLVSYGLSGSLQRINNRLVFSDAANSHLSVLLALFCLSVGIAMWMARFGLAVNQRGPFVGLMYTDRTVRIPAYNLLAVTSAVVAGTAFSNTRSRRWSIPVVGVTCWLVVAAITLGIAPRLLVDAPDLDSAGLDDHIEATLFAYDLDELQLSTSLASVGVSRSADIRKLATRTSVVGDPFGLSDNKTPKASQLISARGVVERAHRIAPFLRFDSAPYPVTLNNRLLWVVDGYTTSDRFPDAQRHSLFSSDLSPRSELRNGFNYIRNSVRVVVDAKDSTTSFYRVDQSDQLIATWIRVFPNLIRPVGDLENDYPGISRNLRYPSDLLAIQASVFGTYRHSSTAALRDGTRRWVPSAQGPIERIAPVDLRVRAAPMARLAKLPGESTARPTLTQTLETIVGTEAARLTAMLSGRVDVEGINTLTFTPILGRLAVPSDVGEIMLNDPAVVTGLASLDPKKVLGQVQVVPSDGDQLVYVRKVYLQPSNAVIGVILYDGSRVLFAKTVAAALTTSASSVGTADQEVLQASKLWELAKQELRDTGDVVSYQKAIEAILSRLTTVPKGTPVLR